MAFWPGTTGEFMKYLPITLSATLFASLLPFLVGGSVIIEYIFNIPGMGRFAFEGVLRREYDVVMATLLLSALLTLAGILVADILYVLVNPQVKFENR